MGRIYLGVRVCRFCKQRRAMLYDEEEEAIVCQSCQGRTRTKAATLTAAEEAALAQFRARYEFYNDLNLVIRRDLGAG